MKEYDNFVMQFGSGMSANKSNGYTEKKTYKYEDKRTKKHGAQRPHKGKMGKYKIKLKYERKDSINRWR